jgi:ribosomal protein S8
MLTVSQIRIGARVRIKRCPVVGTVTKISRNRTRIHVNCRAYKKTFHVSELILVTNHTIVSGPTFDYIAPAMYDCDCGGSPGPE